MKHSHRTKIFRNKPEESSASFVDLASARADTVITKRATSQTSEANGTPKQTVFLSAGNGNQPEQKTDQKRNSAQQNNNNNNNNTKQH